MPKPRAPAVSYGTALGHASADKRIEILRLIGRSGSISQAGREAGVSYMMMRGKPTPNFVDVDAGLLETEEDLHRWVTIAERFVSTKR